MELSFDDLRKYCKTLPLWSILTFAVLTIGFVGFFTFCSLNNIPINEPSIYTLLGFGLFNAIYWALIFFSAIKGKYWNVLKSFMIIGILNWFTFDPIIWGGLTLTYILIYSNTYKNNEKEEEKPNKPGFIERIANKNKVKEHYIKGIIDFIPLLAIFILQIILGSTIRLTTLILVTYFLIQETNDTIHKKHIKGYHIFIVIILIPSFLSYSIIDKVNYSLIGISKSEVLVEKESEEIRGILIFQDLENLYLKLNIESDTTLIIPKSEVKNTTVLKKNKNNFCENCRTKEEIERTEPINSKKTKNVNGTIDTLPNIE